MIDVAKHRFPIFPVKQLLKYNFPSFKYIQKVNCSITIFHGTDDAVVPFPSAKKLFEVAPKANTTFITLEKGQHNNLIDFELYQSEINDILP